MDRYCIDPLSVITVLLCVGMLLVCVVLNVRFPRVASYCCVGYLYPLPPSFVHLGPAERNDPSFALQIRRQFLVALFQPVGEVPSVLSVVGVVPTV